MVIIGLGSTNPSKIKATKEAVTRIFGKAKVIPVKIKNTPIQPTSEDQMISGAILRARLALLKTNADYGVGMEGGIIKNKYGVFVKGWVAVIDTNYIVSIASTLSVELPSYIWDEIKSGRAKELEEIMIQISGIDSIGDKQGAIGFLSGGLYGRADAFRDALICAFGKYKKLDIYRVVKIVVRTII